MKKIKKSNRITILFLSWRDIRSSKMGGAEIYTHEILRRLDMEKYKIIHFSCYEEGLKEDEVIDGVNYIRFGGFLKVIFNARKFYKLNCLEIDYVVNQCNSHRFFTRFYVEDKKRVFFIHQLTREIWDLKLSFPLNLLGKLSENFLLKLNKNDPTMTVSKSTKDDLLQLGFKDELVKIIPEGISFKHLKEEEFLKKEKEPTFIYVGRFSEYKGIDKVCKAFSKIKSRYKDAKLWIVGKKNDDYIKSVLEPIFELENINILNNSDIVFHGFVNENRKLELMGRAHALIFPSLREGWGLIITEAAAVGTPSIGYNSPGIRDAIDYGKTGWLCQDNSVDTIVSYMEKIINDKDSYEEMRIKAYEYSLNFHWDKSAKVMDKFIDWLVGRSLYE